MRAEPLEVDIGPQPVLGRQVKLSDRPASLVEWCLHLVLDRAQARVKQLVHESLKLNA